MYRLILITEERPQGGIRIRTSEFETLLEASSRLKTLLFREAKAELDYEIIDYEVEHAEKIISMGDIDNLLKEKEDEGIEKGPSQKVA